MPDTPVPSRTPSSTGTPAPRRTSLDPWQGFQDEFERLFDRAFSGFGFPALRRGFQPATNDRAFPLANPAVDVAEDDKAYRITAELPGMSEKDIDVTVTDDAVTIRGEKREDSEQKDKNVHVSERRYGAFQRSFGLPPSIDRGKIEAAFDKGVLTVTLPKTTEAVSQQKKIDIKTA